MNPRNSAQVIDLGLSYTKDTVIMSIPSNGIEPFRMVEFSNPCHVFQFITSNCFFQLDNQSELRQVTNILTKAVANDRTIVCMFCSPGISFQRLHLYVYDKTVSLIKGKLALDEQSPPFTPSLLSYCNRQFSLSKHSKL